MSPNNVKYLCILISMQRHSQERHDIEIDELRDSLKEQEKRSEAEKERLKKHEENKRLIEQVRSFRSQYRSSVKIDGMSV